MAFTPLNALSSFLAVARKRSFAAAARELGVSTSALGQSVRQLESRLGVTLLTAERHPRVQVEAFVENRLVNVVAEGLDAGIRLSDAIERDMVQVRLTEPGRFVVAGAPSYLD